MWSTFWVEEVLVLVGISGLSIYTFFLLRFFQFLTPLFFI